MLVLAEGRRVLAPRGRLVVVDGRTPDGPVGRGLDWLYGRLVNWQGNDVLAHLRRAFETVTVTRQFDAGLGFIAVAEPSE